MDRWLRLTPWTGALALVLLLAGPALSARAEVVPLGGIATIDLPPKGSMHRSGDDELERARRFRGTDRLLVTGSVTDGERASAIYEFFRAGRYTEPGHDAFDMRALAERLSGPNQTWNFAGWRTPPVFDREHHVLFWAYDVKSEKARKTFDFAAFCTREGVLVFQRTTDNIGAFEGEDAAFRALLARVRVNDGRRWEDFVSTDEIASGSLADLVANRGVPGEAQSGAHAGNEPADGMPAWLRDLVRNGRFRIGGIFFAIIGLRVLFGIAKALSRRRVTPEEVSMPTGAPRTPKSPYDDNRPIN